MRMAGALLWGQGETHGLFDQLLDALRLSDLGVGRSVLSHRWRRRRNLAQARRLQCQTLRKGPRRVETPGRASSSRQASISE